METEDSQSLCTENKLNNAVSQIIKSKNLIILATSESGKITNLVQGSMSKPGGYHNSLQPCSKLHLVTHLLCKAAFLALRTSPLLWNG